MNGATMLQRYGWAAVLTSIWGACVIDVEEVGEKEVVSAIGRGPCPDQVCGENSPVVDALGFHELNLVGLPNKEKFWIFPAKGPAQIVKSLASYDLNVVNGFITGSRNNVTMLSGPALKGAMIKVQRGTATFTLKIADVRSMHYFLVPQDPVEAYRLEWAKDPDDHFVNLCGGIPLLLNEGLGQGGGGEVDPSHAELMNMTVWEAVVFEGDRIDSATKTMSKVASVENDKWFNIGCATSAPAKLLLTHHTIHSQAPQLRAWEQRQAMFKMYVADYCNTGDSFTVARQTLVWRKDPVWDYLFPPWKLEARWTENGAKCLNNPRMLYPSTPLGPIYFRDIYDALNAANCHPPSCMNNLDPYDLGGADRVSSNPVP
jgi:hypothetical protein